MSKNVFHIPSGPKNLQALFPLVNFAQVSEYYVEVKNDTNAVIATTPTYKANCCCPEGGFRVFFLSYLGAYDGVNFEKPSVIHEDEADEFQNALSHPLKKTDTGFERFNVRSNDTYTARHKCNEADMIWLQECADSPKMFMQWKGTEGQADDYLPIVKVSGSFEKLKNVQDFTYEFVLEFKLANEFMTLRN